MPSRFVREGIISSVPVNQLSDSAELFYRRLLSVVDDYGRFHAHPGLLRAACYPLRLHHKSEKDVSRYLAECVQNGLVRLFNGGDCLEVLKFRQQQRGKTKYPEVVQADLLNKCLSIAKQPISNNSNRGSPPNTDTLSDSDSGKGEMQEGETLGKCREVVAFLNSRTGQRYRESERVMGPLRRLFDAGFTVADVKGVIHHQTQEWRGTQMQKYLRPETLFGPKFDTYLAQKDLPVIREVNGHSVRAVDHQKNVSEILKLGGMTQ